jgi:aryl carrier-like protein
MSMLAQGKTFNMTADTRTLQFSAYTFDVSIGDIFTTLIHSGCVIIISEDERMNNLAKAASLANVNLAILTPTVASLIRPEDLPTLKTLILVGEAVKQEVVTEWAHITVLNAYGPAESSILSTCSRPLGRRVEAANIGFALHGGLWVVDESDFNQLCPIGVAGELLLEGPLLARGYLHDADKTAAVFVTDPAWVRHLHSSSTGRRMYRTGDIARQNTDGSLVYIGRRDTQIKINGQRVEVGEIEHHILRCPSVMDAVVIQPQTGPFQFRLIALITCKDSITNSAHDTIQPIDINQQPKLASYIADIQADLVDNVLEYMVPSGWIALQTMPLNDSGKTNRRQLRQWAEGLDLSSIYVGYEDQFQAPTTIQEERLQAVWAEVLNRPVSEISTSRSFLSLGGDSITAMQVVSRSRGHGILITVRDILQSKSITQLSSVATSTKTEPWSLQVSNQPFRLSPIQQLYMDSIASQGLRADGDYRYNQSLALGLQRKINGKELSYAMDVIIERHPMLRVRFSGNASQGWTQAIEANVAGSYHFQIHRTASPESAAEIVACSPCIFSRFYHHRASRTTAALLNSTPSRG